MIQWPLPANYVDNPACTPAGLRDSYTRLLQLLATADRTMYHRQILDAVRNRCVWFGLPSPYSKTGPVWARSQLAILLPRTEPAPPVGVEGTGSPDAE